MFNRDETRMMVGRATTIDDRLSGRSFISEPSEPTAATQKRFEAWCKSAADGNHALFTNRLKMDGLDVDTTLVLLDDMLPYADEQASTWTATLNWVLEAIVSSGEARQSADFIDPEQPRAFEDLFANPVTAAYDRLQKACAPELELLTNEAVADLQRSLLLRLTKLCGPALYEGFTIFRTTATPASLFTGVPYSGDPGSRALYEQYLMVLRQGGLRDVFLERPVLARLVATLTDQWLSATKEFLERLSADFDLICRTFSPARSPGHVIQVEGELSDCHNGGRRVLRIVFSDGLEIGYKPKDLGLDLAWRQFLIWLDKHGAPGSAIAPVALSRSGFGWVEWLRPEPCTHISKAERFFQRAGGMLCLIHLLRGTDFHFENVLALGEFPVPFDLETLLHPSLPQLDRVGLGKSAADRARERLRNSVVATSYLPRWMTLPGGFLSPVGGLSPEELQDATTVGFDNLNSDGMTVAMRPAHAPRTLNLPILDGQVLSVAEFGDQFKTGFTQMYRFLLSNKAVLLDPNGPLAAFYGQTVRVILRPTILYNQVLQKSLSTRNLSNGVDWSLHFDFLSRFSDFQDEYAKVRTVQSAERRALERLDIPFLTSRTNCRDLFLSDGTSIENYFEQSSFEEVMLQTRGLSETALRDQIRIIEQTLQSLGCDSDSQPVAVNYVESQADCRTPTLTAEQAINTGCSIARELKKQAIFGEDGAAWIGSVPLGGGSRAQLDAIGHDLYSGASGIALFLSTLYRLTGDQVHRELSLAAIEPFRRNLDNPSARNRMARMMGVGGATGLGSVIYSLARSAIALDEPSLIVDAVRTSHLIHDHLIESDRSYDVVAGTAGAILGLLALHEVSDDFVALERAVKCGHHLVKHQYENGFGGKTWTTWCNRELTGFSHGAAGIVLALLRLYRRTDEVAFLTAAHAGVAYENAVFSTQLQAWPDFRDETPATPGRQMPCQWCHGAAGIGLARLGGLEVMNTSVVREDIDRAIQITLDAQTSRVDHLCCGNFGRLEFLFAAGHKLNREDLTRLTFRQAANLCARAEQFGSFRWMPGAAYYNPGLFTGNAGVGYQLLRMTHPLSVPSVLLWD